MRGYTAYHNGIWLPSEEIKPDPTDRGVILGDQVVEVVRTFDGKSFRMREHIDRLYNSLKYIRIDPGMSREEMVQVSEEAISRNEHLREEGNDFSIRQLVTRGPTRGLRAWTAGPPNIYITVSPMAFENFSPFYLEGAHGAITRTLSYDPESLDPKVKHLSRMNMTLAELEANDVDPGAWPIMRDQRGNLTEGSGYNVFIVTDGILRTPGDRAVLAGVSRAMIFDLASQLDIQAYEEDLQPYDMYTADEAFFTSTPFSIMPLVQVDRREISDGKTGEITQQLMAAWSESVGVDIVDQMLRNIKER